MLAGCAWGVYSIAGKRAPDALASNARSFVGAVPLALALELLTIRSVRIDARGALLALASGGITSGLGYAIWYRALRGLTATQAAILQLSVPVIAALAAVALLGETLNPRLVSAGAAVLGGVAVVLSERARPVR